MIKRYEDWPTQLEKAIISRYDTKFQYGNHDCCMGVAFIIEAMTGVNVGATLKKYKNKKGAMLVLARFGGVRGAAEHFAKVIDAPSVPVKLAKRGDVVLVETDQGEALGFVSMNGRLAYVAGNPSGWRSFPVENWLHAWSIG